jgi:hypothetical protein
MPDYTARDRMEGGREGTASSLRIARYSRNKEIKGKRRP